MLFLALVVELIALFFLSRWVTKSIFCFLLLVFRSRTIAVSLLLVLEFPGTVVHELAHLFTAGILGVRTGKMTLDPPATQAELGEALRAGPGKNATIITGSVAVAETGPFRKYLIGLAPLSWGILILSAIAYFLPELISKGLDYQTVPLWQNPSFYLLVGAGYLLFAVSNAMFPSQTDMKGFLPFGVALTAIGVLFYFLGFRFMLTGVVLDLAVRIVTTLAKSLGVVVGINVVLWIITILLTRLFSKLFRIMIVQR